MKNRLLRRIALAGTLLALFLVFLPGLAEGSDAQPTNPPLRRILEISLGSRPAALVTAGEVTLTFSISNASEYDAQNVYLTSSDGLHSEPLGQIPAGEAQTFNRAYTVSEEELERGEISFILTHDPASGAEPVEYTVSVPIERAIAQPMAEFTTQFSSVWAPAGGTITITYRVRNTGNVPLKQIRVSDRLGDFTGRVEELDIGETRVFTSHVTISEESVSEPTVSYTVPAEDDAPYETTLSARRIFIAEPLITADFSADRTEVQYGDNVALTLTIQNLGNVNLQHIVVTDAVRGGLIASSMSLPVGGEPISIAHVYPIRSTEDFCFHIEALAESGEQLSLDTQTITVQVPEETPSGSLELTASALTPKIRRAGDVTFAISLKTEALTGIRRVRLSEQTRGEIRTYEIIPAGDPMTASVTYNVQEDGEYTFIAEWTDEEGTHIVRALPVQVEISSDGVVPETQNGQARSGLFGARVRVGENDLFLYLILAGVLVLLGLIAALAFTSRKEKRAVAQREQRKKAQEDLQKTNRFVPIRASSARRGRHRKSAESADDSN